MSQPANANAIDGRVALRLALASFLFFALFHHGHFKGSDEVGFLKVTRSLFEDGSMAVPPGIHTEEGADGRRYSHFSLGQSLAALPFYALGRLAEATLPEAAVRAMAGPDNMNVNQRFSGDVVIFTTAFHAPAVCAMLVALFFLFQRELGVSLRTAVACSALFAGTTYLMLMSTFFLRHTSEAVTLVGALYFYHRWKRAGETRDLFFGSLLASLTLIVRLPAGVGGLAIAGYLAWCVRERGGGRFDPAVIRRALLPVLVPLLAVVAISTGLDYARWGVPWNLPQFRTGSLLETPLYVSVYAALLSPGMSVFVYSPLLLLVPWTFPVLWRRQRAEAVTFLVLSLSFLIAFSSFRGWTGLWSSPGPRYQFISVPLLMLPLGLWLDACRGWRPRAAVAVLAALGAWVQLALITVHWGGLIERMDWKSFYPVWSFLYLPDHSPVVGASRALLAWEMRDNWLLQLSRGWPGQPGHPVAALVILLSWGLALGACLVSLRRQLNIAGRSTV